MEDTTRRLEEKRRSYALSVTGHIGIDRESTIGRAIMEAFELIPRENFVGAPPWRIVAPEGHQQSVASNVEDLYQDVLVSLDLKRGLNNGQPSLHAYCLNALAPRNGEKAVHVGTGTGYYTAILAKLVGEVGRVDGYEIEPDLADQAAANLSTFSQVETHSRSGAEAPLPECDVLYVSAACAEPLGVWLDALRYGGRLLFPLAPGGEAGQMLLVTRNANDCYAAQFLGAVQFVACIGAQDDNTAQRLEVAYRGGNWKAVKSLKRNNEPDESCWFAGRGWWLSTH